MGHGSDVQSIMTTATFDAKTDEIVLHTPCIEAMKFWPGDMGLYANYALVFARLLVDGQDQGVHAFLARIRDDQMNPMPGV
jgi:acyl-CoA oxidase